MYESAIRAATAGFLCWTANAGRVMRGLACPAVALGARLVRGVGEGWFLPRSGV
jgi:hypothetical protein